MFKYVSVIAVGALTLAGCGSSQSSDENSTVTKAYDLVQYLPESGHYIQDIWHATSDSISFEGEDNTTVVANGNMIQINTTLIIVKENELLFENEYASTTRKRYYNLNDSIDEVCLVTTHYDMMEFSAFGEQVYNYSDVLETVCTYEDGDVIKEYYAKGLGQVARVDYDCRDDNGVYHDADALFECFSEAEYREFLNLEKSSID